MHSNDFFGPSSYEGGWSQDQSFDGFLSDFLPGAFFDDDAPIPGSQSPAVYVVESREESVARANGAGSAAPGRKMSAALLAGMGLVAGGIIFWAVRGS